MSAQDRIVIRRKKVVAGGHHGGSWKIAYADFVTAMLALFLVMWLLSLVPKPDLKTIAEYFRMPLMEAIQGGPQAAAGSTVITAGSPSIIPNPYSLTPPIEGGDDGSAQQSQIEADRVDIERLEDLQTELEELIATDPVLQQFKPQLLLDMTPDGLRVQIIDQQNR